MTGVRADVERAIGLSGAGAEEVAEVHSFYVAAGSEYVLVHNECLPELRDWPSRRFQFGPSTYLIDKSDLTHILTRHHPRYWNGSGSEKDIQTFFDERLTITDIERLIDEIARQNRDQLVALGTVSESSGRRSTARPTSSA